MCKETIIHDDTPLEIDVKPLTLICKAADTSDCQFPQRL